MLCDQFDLDEEKNDTQVFAPAGSKRVPATTDVFLFCLRWAREIASGEPTCPAAIKALQTIIAGTEFPLIRNISPGKRTGNEISALWAALPGQPHFGACYQPVCRNNAHGKTYKQKERMNE